MHSNIIIREELFNIGRGSDKNKILEVNGGTCLEMVKFPEKPGEGFFL